MEILKYFQKKKNTFLPSWDEGFDISASKLTNIEIMRRFDKKLKSPVFKCLDDTETYDSDLYRNTTTGGQLYRQKYFSQLSI